MAEQTNAPPAGAITTLDELRAAVREHMLAAGERLAVNPVLVSDVELLEGLVRTYRTLGGELDVTPPAPPELALALKRLDEATHGLALEDFPPRVRPVAEAVNAVVEAAR